MQENVPIESYSGLRRILFPIFVVMLLFNSTFAHAQVIIKVNDTVNFKFGTLIQAWADELQDATTRGYANNLYLRRVRFIVAGQVAPNVTFFLQTDNPNVGKAPKAFVGTFLLQDAWVEWKLRDEFMLEAGLFLVPLNRSLLTSSGSNMTLDISPTSTVATTGLTQSNGNRDTGFQAKGYLADGRLEYRAGVAQGIRDAAARNPFRKSAYLQYDFWEKERGYVYAGTSLGKKKILALSGGYDAQKGYKAYSGSFTAHVPMAGNEFATQLMVNHYDGGAFIKTLARQNDLDGEFAYYVAPLKIQPFAKIEKQDFKTTVSNATTDVMRYGAGANYYVYGQNLKLTGQILHVVPKNKAIHSTNEATVQFQIFYN